MTLSDKAKSNSWEDGDSFADGDEDYQDYDDSDYSEQDEDSEPEDRNGAVIYYIDGNVIPQPR